MALKSGISGISRRPATEPDEAGSTELTPRDRLMRRAGVTTAVAAADSAAPQRVDDIDAEELAAEEETEIVAQGDAEDVELMPAFNDGQTYTDTEVGTNGDVGDPALEDTQKEFKPEPVGKSRGRPKAKPPEDDAKAPGLSIVELRAEIKGLEMEFKDISVAQKELDARKGDAFERYNDMTGRLAMALVGG